MGPFREGESVPMRMRYHCPAIRHWRGCDGHTNADDIELKAALEQLLLNLGGDAVETDVALGEDRGRLLRVERHVRWDIG